MAVALSQDERVLVDVTCSLSSLSYSAVQLVLVTALSWIAIGVVDKFTMVGIHTGMHNFFLLLWLVLVLWRFVLPIIRKRRKRLLLTTRRVIIREEGLSTRLQTIPLHAIHSVGRHRNTLSFHFASEGIASHIEVTDVAKARKIAELVDATITHP